MHELNTWPQEHSHNINIGARPLTPWRHYYMYVFYSLHANHRTTFLEWTLANSASGNLLPTPIIPFINHHHHPWSPPSTTHHHHQWPPPIVNDPQPRQHDKKDVAMPCKQVNRCPQDLGDVMMHDIIAIQTRWVNPYPYPLAYFTWHPGATLPAAMWQPNDEWRWICHSSLCFLWPNGEHPPPNPPDLTYQQTTTWQWWMQHNNNATQRWHSMTTQHDDTTGPAPSPLQWWQQPSTTTHKCWQRPITVTHKMWWGPHTMAHENWQGCTTTTHKTRQVPSTPHPQKTTSTQQHHPRMTMRAQQHHTETMTKAQHHWNSARCFPSI